MDLTGWLEFFTEGLATQLGEVRARGEAVIRADLMARECRLTERQPIAIQLLLGQPDLGIDELEAA